MKICEIIGAMLGEQQAPENDITQIINDEIAKIGKTPQEINIGLCGELADVVVSRVGGQIIDSDDIELSSPSSHIFIAYHGRFYDAENPDGVDDWRHLTYFRRYQERRKARGLSAHRWL